MGILGNTSLNRILTNLLEHITASTSDDEQASGMVWFPLWRNRTPPTSPPKAAAEVTRASPRSSQKWS